MAIKSLKSGAWEETDDMKVPVSGAYQTADHANALVSGAWQEVWSAAYWLVKAGVLQNDTQISTHPHTSQMDGYILHYYTYECTNAGLIYFKLTPDLIGKKLYVKLSALKEQNWSSGTTTYPIHLYYQCTGDSYSNRHQPDCSVKEGDYYVIDLTFTNIDISQNVSLVFDSEAAGWHCLYDAYIE